MKIETKFLLTSLLCLVGLNAMAERPNVILIMTDDQGYGDLACHGNPVIQTPELDRLHNESIRLTNFHVAPFCTPTRAALMTGRYPARTGAYRTASGRCMLHTDERTIAEAFADAGYATGMVGKWHLGDNAPHRPQDRGFQDVVWHHAGGIGQAADYWGNTYFNDHYERNGTFEKFEGYCTDVFFAESMRFVDENKSKPFFLYLAPNAPHSPYKVDAKWSAPYKEIVKWKGGAEFYGMIANIDYNVGLLRTHLEKLGIAENTILIFMTDNGTSAGIARKSILGPDDFRGWLDGVRGVKSTVWEGGHRVPFFIHWPKGGLVGGRDDAFLSGHIDVLPTLAELCGVTVSATPKRDGLSFTARLNDPKAPASRDHLVIQMPGGPRFEKAPAPFDTSVVIQGDWRLMDGTKLFNFAKDRMQNNDVASDHPERVAALRALYEPFWDSVSPRMTPVSIDLGNPAQNPTELCSQDWYMPTGNPPWHYGAINSLVRVTGPWYVDVKQAGRYRLTLRQFPAVANKSVIAERAKVKIAGQEMESKVESGTRGVVFEMDLPTGKTTLETWLYDKKDEAGGAYFTEVELM